MAATTWLSVPQDAWTLICGFLDASSLGHLSASCTTLYSAAVTSARLHFEDAFGESPPPHMPIGRLMAYVSQTGDPQCATELILWSSMHGYVRMVATLADRSNGALVNCRGVEGVSPLILAAQYNQCKVASALLQAGANVMTCISGAVNAAHVAAGLGFVDMLQLLLQSNPRAANSCTAAGLTPLMLAAARGCDAAVKVAIAAGGDVNASVPVHYNTGGETALHFAARNGFLTTVKLLLDNEADIDAAARNGKTALLIASEFGSSELVKLLLARGAAVNSVTESGKTPVYTAAERGDADLVHLLMEAGGDVNQPTHRDKTPLYIAAEKGYVDVARALLTRCAPDAPFRATKYGTTPLFIATRNSNKEMKDLLVSFCLPGHRGDAAALVNAARPQSPRAPSADSAGAATAAGAPAGELSKEERRRLREQELALAARYPTPRFMSDLLGLESCSSIAAELAVKLGVDKSAHTIVAKAVPKGLYQPRNPNAAAENAKEQEAALLTERQAEMDGKTAAIVQSMVDRARERLREKEAEIEQARQREIALEQKRQRQAERARKREEDRRRKSFIARKKQIEERTEEAIKSRAAAIQEQRKKEAAALELPKRSKSSRPAKAMGSGSEPDSASDVDSHDDAGDESVHELSDSGEVAVAAPSTQRTTARSIVTRLPLSVRRSDSESDDSDDQGDVEPDDHDDALSDRENREQPTVRSPPTARSPAKSVVSSPSPLRVGGARTVPSPLSSPGSPSKTHAGTVWCGNRMESDPTPRTSRTPERSPGSPKRRQKRQSFRRPATAAGNMREKDKEKDTAPAVVAPEAPAVVAEPTLAQSDEGSARVPATSPLRNSPRAVPKLALGRRPMSAAPGTQPTSARRSSAVVPNMASIVFAKPEGEELPPPAVSVPTPRGSDSVLESIVLHGTSVTSTATRSATVASVSGASPRMRPPSPLVIETEAAPPVLPGAKLMQHIVALASPVITAPIVAPKDPVPVPLPAPVSAPQSPEEPPAPAKPDSMDVLSLAAMGAPDWAPNTAGRGFVGWHRATSKPLGVDSLLARIAMDVQAAAPAPVVQPPMKMEPATPPVVATIELTPPLAAPPQPRKSASGGVVTAKWSKTAALPLTRLGATFTDDTLGATGLSGAATLTGSAMFTSIGKRAATHAADHATPESGVSSGDDHAQQVPAIPIGGMLGKPPLPPHPQVLTLMAPAAAPSRPTSAAAARHHVAAGRKKSAVRMQQQQQQQYQAPTPEELGAVAPQWIHDALQEPPDYEDELDREFGTGSDKYSQRLMSQDDVFEFLDFAAVLNNVKSGTKMTRGQVELAARLGGGRTGFAARRLGGGSRAPHPRPISAMMEPTGQETVAFPLRPASAKQVQAVAATHSGPHGAVKSADPSASRVLKPTKVSIGSVAPSTRKGVAPAGWTDMNY